MGAQVLGCSLGNAAAARAEFAREVGKVVGIGGQCVLGSPALGREHIEEQPDQGLVGICGLRGHAAMTLRAALRTCPAESKP